MWVWSSGFVRFGMFTLSHCDYIGINGIASENTPTLARRRDPAEHGGFVDKIQRATLIFGTPAAPVRHPRREFDELFGKRHGRTVAFARARAHRRTTAFPHSVCMRRGRRPPVRIGVVQLTWGSNERAHDAAISEGVRTAADEGADLVCLPELTRLPYIAYDERGPQPGGIAPEPLPGGSTYELVAKLAVDTGVAVHASCYEQAEDALGFNTAFVVAPRRHARGQSPRDPMQVTAGYAEDRWFAPGDTGYPVFNMAKHTRRLADLLRPMVPGGTRPCAERRRRHRVSERDRQRARSSHVRH